jgi:malonyl CoA-acyl carrier protein transacylase
MSACVINAGHTHEEVAEEVARLRKDPECGLVEVASYNSAAQIVLAGSRAGVFFASERLTELGIAARAADLPIACDAPCLASCTV